MSENNRARLRQAQAAKAKQKRLNRIIGVAAGVLALAVIGVVIVVAVQQAGKGNTSTAVTPPNATSDGKAIAISPGKAKQGAPLVELFFDYQCPGCKGVETTYGSAFEELAASGEIALHNRNLTFMDQNLHNTASSRAGIAAACADTVGSYVAYHDQVFANQPENEGEGYTDMMLRNTFPEAAGITGDNLTAFQTCYDQQSTKAFVSGTNEQGQKDLLEVMERLTTPTILVNGKVLPPEQLPQTATAAALGEVIKKNA